MSAHGDTNGRYPTSLGTSTRDEIRLLGRSLTGELMGQVSLAELTLWMLRLRRPTREEGRLFEAVLVGLADHGYTPTAIVAKLTFLSAPDSLQGALAAGVLGGGSRYLGVTEDTGQFLGQVLDAQPAGHRLDAGAPDADWNALANSAVAQAVAEGRRIPGLGHHLHKDKDPRTAVLCRIAEECGRVGPHQRLLLAIGEVHADLIGRRLPLNGAGMSGAILADLGVPYELLRGPVLLARCAGLLGHIAEEIRRPTANDMFMTIERDAVYVPPDGPVVDDSTAATANVRIPYARPHNDQHTTSRDWPASDDSKEQQHG